MLRITAGGLLASHVLAQRGRRSRSRRSAQGSPAVEGENDGDDADQKPDDIFVNPSRGQAANGYADSRCRYQEREILTVPAFPVDPDTQEVHGDHDG